MFSLVNNDEKRQIGRGHGHWPSIHNNVHWLVFSWLVLVR